MVIVPAYSGLYSQVTVEVDPAVRVWPLVGAEIASKPSVCAKTRLTRARQVAA